MAVSLKNRKAFWKNVTLEEKQEEDRVFYRPLLDERPIILPKGHILQVSARHLGEAIAEEWRNIKENSLFTAEELPLTRIAGTMIERIAPALEETYQNLLAYAQDDNFCYRSPAQKSEIGERVSLWLQQYSLSPQMTDSLMPIEQDGLYLRKLRDILENKNLFYLASLGVLAPLFGSLILPLILLERAIEEEELFEFGFADEFQQLKKWGEDFELRRALEKRKEEMREALSFYHLSLDMLL